MDQNKTIGYIFPNILGDLFSVRYLMYDKGESTDSTGSTVDLRWINDKVFDSRPRGSG
jgi:hypothetical protein